MINILKGFASIKITLIVGAVAFVVGAGSGAWLLNKLYAQGKINMLDKYISKQGESHRLTVENLNVLHKKNIRIAKDDAVIERVNKYVKDNRDCDLNHNATRLLNRSRTGLPITTAGADDPLAGLADITQRQQVTTCAKDGIQYRKEKAKLEALQRFIRENWKEK